MLLREKNLGLMLNMVVTRNNFYKIYISILCLKENKRSVIYSEWLFSTCECKERDFNI